MWLKRSLVCTACVVALTLMAGCGYCRDQRGETRDVRAEIARIRACGEPVSMADLAGTPIPASKNAASIYASVFKAMDGPKFAKDDDVMAQVTRADSPLPTAEQWEAARQAFTKYEEVLPLVERAVVQPACRFPVDWSKGPLKVEFPHFQKICNLCRFLCVGAMISARDGNVDQACRLLALDFKVSESLRQNDSCLIGMLVRIVTIRMGVRALRNVLLQRDLSASQAIRVESALRVIDLKPALRQALLTERAMGIGVFDDVRRHGLAAVVSEDFVRSVPAYNSCADELCHLRLTKTSIDLTCVPYRQVKRQHLELGDNNIPKYAAVTRILLPVLIRVLSVRDVAQAEIAGSRICLELCRYKLRFGSYPANLTELKNRLGWQPPEDPFSGHDFIYKPMPHGFLLYSIGPNLKDDGGREPGSKDSASATGDIVWKLGR